MWKQSIRDGKVRYVGSSDSNTGGAEARKSQVEASWGYLTMFCLKNKQMEN